jgi:hypothetical protein
LVGSTELAGLFKQNLLGWFNRTCWVVQTNPASSVTNQSGSVRTTQQMLFKQPSRFCLKNPANFVFVSFFKE